MELREKIMSPLLEGDKNGDPPSKIVAPPPHADE